MSERHVYVVRKYQMSLMGNCMIILKRTLVLIVEKATLSS